MRMKTGHCLLEVGKRLGSIRAEIGCNRSVMAQRLGLKQKTYYKNEVGLALPCFETLQRLQNEFDISMDWLLFKKGPTHTKDKEILIVEEKKTTGIENKLAEVKELLTAMEQDQALLHEIMLYYYNYKKK